MAENVLIAIKQMLTNDELESKTNEVYPCAGNLFHCCYFYLFLNLVFKVDVNFCVSLINTQFPPLPKM